MGRRLELHDEFLHELGIDNVYFQPPEKLKLNYPCMVYQLNTGDTQFANNKPYLFRKQYMAIYITPDPDSDMPRKIALHFPMSRMDRFYTADNLNHYVFMIYY